MRTTTLNAPRPSERPLPFYRVRLPLHGRHADTDRDRPASPRRAVTLPCNRAATEAEAARHAVLAGCRRDVFWWF